MKIRIKGNAIRYRLTKTEVATFSEKGYFEEITLFPNGAFKYALRSAPEIEDLYATFEKDTITLFFPEKNQKEWYESNIVGYKHLIELPGGEILSLLIEKDFACLDNTEEDQSDNYENPNATC